mgnify:CR=1 FL=1
MRNILKGIMYIAITTIVVVLVGCDADVKKKNSSVSNINNGTRSFVCTEYTATNYIHVENNRAETYQFGLYARTIGSGESLGLYGSMYYSPETTISETTPGHFKLGNCPVDEEPPTVQLNGLTENQLITAESISVSADANDDVAVEKVNFYLNNDIVHVDYNAPYTADIVFGALTNGDYRYIKAEAVDTAGNKTMHSIQFKLRKESPGVFFNDGTPYIDDVVYKTITVAAIFRDDQSDLRAEIYVGSTKIFNTDSVASNCNNSNCTTTFDTTTVADGEYYLKAVAIDFDGNRSETTRRIIIDNTSDLEKPVITSYTFPSGSHINGSIILTADATDNVGVAKVVFTAGVWVHPFSSKSYTLCEVTVKPYMCVFNTSQYPNGDYNVTVRAIDTNGNVGNGHGRSYFVVNSDNRAPAINITSHSDGQSVSGVIRFEGTVIDQEGVVQDIQLWVDGEQYNGIQAVGMQYWETDPPHPITSLDTENYDDGLHTITFKAIDYAGNMSEYSMQLRFMNNSTCTNHRSTNLEHINAGRAFGGGFLNMYAITNGGNDDLGLVGTSWYSATTDVMETAPGFFEAGVCPE